MRPAGALSVRRACAPRHWDVRDTCCHHFYEARNKNGLRLGGRLEEPGNDKTRNQYRKQHYGGCIRSLLYIHHGHQSASSAAWRGSAREMEWDGRTGRANKSWVYFWAALYIGSAIMAASSLPFFFFVFFSSLFFMAWLLCGMREQHWRWGRGVLMGLGSQGQRGCV